MVNGKVQGWLTPEAIGKLPSQIKEAEVVVSSGKAG